MRNMLGNLEEAGMNFGQVVATNVYLDDLSDLPAFDKRPVFWRCNAGLLHHPTNRTRGA